MATMYPDDEEEVRPRRVWLLVLILLFVAFVGGGIAATYVVSHDPRTQHFLGLVSAEQAAMERQLAQRIVIRPVPVPAKAGPPPSADEVSARVTTLENKVGDIETQAREATGDASRAEGLLVAFAARRALDRGVALGYIEGLLRQRFGGTQPQAVAAVLSASRQPVTLADLETGLDALAPTLAAGGPPQQSWWQSFRQELSNMVVVRKTGQPSTAPADRVDRAQRMLEAGQVDAALAEVMRVPDHSAAGKWILSARRYVIGRGALDQIETAALLDPSGIPGGVLRAPAAAPATAVATPGKPAVTPPVD